MQIFSAPASDFNAKRGIVTTKVAAADHRLAD